MPLGEVNVGRNLDSYTLNEFKTLADNSQDNQELRIRKSNQELSNTPLGFIARNFGSTHANSNARVTEAFKHALQSDPKYRTINVRLAGVLSTQMPANQPLTAAKVKSAIGMADRMLQAQENSIALRDMAEDFQLVSSDKLDAFKGFVMDFLFTHPDVKLDLGNIGEKLTPEQSRQDPDALQKVLHQQEDSKLEALSTILKAFYKQAGAQALGQGGYGLPPSKTGGDAQLAAALTKLFSQLTSIPTETDAIIDGAFDYKTAQLPKSGCIAKPFQNALSNFFAKRLDATNLEEDMTGILHMNAQDIDKITDAINSNPDIDKWSKNKVVRNTLLAVDAFFSQHPALAAQPEKMQQALGELTAKLVDLISSGNTAADDYMLAADQLSIKLLMNEQALSLNGESLFAKAGVDPKIGLAALSDPSVFQQLTAKVQTLDAKRTDEQIAQTVREEVGKFLEQNASLLQKVQNAGLPENLLATGVETALVLNKAITSISQGQARNEELMLEQLRSVAQALGDKSLTDADRGLILKNLIGEFAKDLAGGTEQLCRDNLPVFARLVGQLQTLSGDPSISQATRDACTEVAVIAQAVYNNLLALAPEDRQLELALVPNRTDAPDPNIAANVNPLKSIPRNASPAQMFAGFAELEASGMNAEDQVLYRKTMESLGCPDYKLLKPTHGAGLKWISNSTRTLTESNEGYKVLSHLHNDLSGIASSVESTQKALAGYDPDQINEFIADVYLSGLSSEQKQNLLSALKDPGVQDYLQVVNSYAQKNSALPDNAVVPKLLTLGNKGQFLAQAVRVLQIAADKAAQQIGAPAPGPIFDANGTKTIQDLSKSFDFDENFSSNFCTSFRKACTPFDDSAYLVGHHLSAAQHDAVNNLFSNLKMPASRDGIDTAYGQVPDKDYTFTYTNPQGQKCKGAWNTKMLGILFAFHADAVSALIESTGGNPSAQQLWGVMHGGQPPADLTMDNFADKVMRSICQQIYSAGVLLGQPTVIPENIFSTCALKIGMNPMDLIKKIVQSAHGDVKFTFSDQVGQSGLFPQPSLMGKSYEDGSVHYAFGNDFIRAIMPPGAKPGPKGETGCKITVQPEEGAPVEFNQSDYEKVPKNEKGAYLSQIPNEVRKLCQSNAQLAGVGVCTTQAVLGALRSVPFFFADVTGGALEHTALDHHISKLENGNILVKITEKPGSLFNMDLQFEVAPNGMVSIRPESSLTLPSLEKVRAYEQSLG